MALEIAERNHHAASLLVVGIRENGLVIANIIAALIREVYPGTVDVYALNIDKKDPGEIVIEPAMEGNGKVILMVDDVANSGRTMLYALQPLLPLRPSAIQTLALVERTHKSFPVDVDYVGISVSTTLDEHITVEVDNGEVTGAWME